MIATPLHYGGQYAGDASVAMRAQFPHAAPEVLRLCCILGDILLDIYTTPVPVSTLPAKRIVESVELCQPEKRRKASSRASSTQPSRMRAASKPSTTPKRRKSAPKNR